MAEKNLKFVKALDIAMAMELAEKCAADLQDSTSKGACSASGMNEGDVNFIKKLKSFKDTECWFCHSKGHVQRFCKLRLTQREAKSEQTRVQNRNLDVNKVPSKMLKMTLIQKLKSIPCLGHRAKRNLIQCR